MDDKKFNWLQILITAIVTGIITVIAGFTLFKIQERQPRLTYSTIETIPFEGTNKIIGIYNIRIANEGKKDIREVVCVVKVDSSTIEQYKVSVNPANTHSEEIEDDVFTLKLSGLNPSEEASISILASSSQKLPQKPEVALRSTGTTGVAKSEISDNKKLTLLRPVIIGVIVSMILLTLFYHKSKAPFSEKRHSGDQRSILAYLCNLFDLREEENRYRNLHQTVEYWSESDRLSMIAIESKSEDLAHKTTNLLKELTKYASMTDDSKGIVYYNIARIAAAFHDDSTKETYLRNARKIVPNIIEKRLKMNNFSKSLLE